MKGSSKSYAVLAVLVLSAVSLGVYSVTLGYGFVYDDRSQVLENPWIRDLSRIPEILTSSGTSFQNKQANTFRPLLHLAFMAEYHLFGLKAWGYHLVNMVLHAMNAVVTFFAVSLLFSDKTAGTLRGGSERLPISPFYSVVPPFFAGLLFALHPVNTEVVSWVSASPELTFTLFLLLSFYIHMKGREEGNSALYIPSLVFFFLALLGKETALSLLFVIFAYEYPRSEGRLLRGAKYTAPYAIVAALYMVLRTRSVGGVVHHRQAALGAYEAFLNALPLAGKYLGKLVWPADLNALYEFHPVSSVTDPGVMAGAIVVIAFIAALYLARKSAPALVGLVIAGVPLLPVLYIPALSAAPFADRYMYLPTIGLAVLFSYAMKQAFSMKPSGIGAAGAAFLITAVALSSVYAYASVNRSLVWKDDYSLWGDTVKKSPDNSNVHYNYAWASQERGDLNAAVEHYREAIRLDPSRSADARYNIGVIYARERKFDEAAIELREALRLDPGFPGAAGRLQAIERYRGANASPNE